jgi:hypothetical protein
VHNFSFPGRASESLVRMPPYGQLLHVEEFQVEGQTYRLAVFREDGGIMGKWSCEICELDDQQEECSAYSSVEGCLTNIKKTVREHHQTEHGQSEKVDSLRKRRPRGTVS